MIEGEEIIFECGEFVYNKLKDERVQREIYKTINNFRWLYHQAMIWTNTKYMGIPIMKCPLDLWATQEILFELKPRILIETGTWMGASALFYAHLMDNIGTGEVITIDNENREGLTKHPRINYVLGDCLSLETIDKVRKLVHGDTVMVNLDSAHYQDHVLKEMELYAPFVTDGSYMIVEDGILGHPSNLETEDGKFIFPGPYEAIDKFLQSHKEFESDRTRERHLMTFNIKGFLRKVGDAKN